MKPAYDSELMRIRVVGRADPLLRSRPPGRLVFDEDPASRGQLLWREVVRTRPGVHVVEREKGDQGVACGAGGPPYHTGRARQ
jgi:hypothetical protein